MIRWGIVALAFVLAVLHSAWWWIAAVALIVWRINQWYFWNGRPWRKCHYPTMRTYATAAARETLAARREGREFDVVEAATDLVRLIQPAWSESEARSFVQLQVRRCEDFEDEGLIVDEFRRRKPRLSADDIEKVSEVSRKLLVPPDNATVVRFVVAGLIEKQYGRVAPSTWLKS
jgi:hypothetical protein